MSYEPKAGAHTSEHLGELQLRSLKYSERRRLIDLDDQTAFMLGLLELCVQRDGEPVFDADGWDQYAGDEIADALAIFEAASALNGFSPKVVEGN